MDGEMKQLRVRFSGVGKKEKGGSQTLTIPQENSSFGRAQMSNGEEYDAAFAAAVAAAAYAITQEEEKLAPQNKPVPIELPTTRPPPKSPVKTGESMKRPTGGSKISRWFSGKEPAEYDDDGPVNVSVRRPLKPAQRTLEDTTSDQRVPQKMLNSTPSVKKAPSFSSKPSDKKGSKKFEQEEVSQKAPPPVRPATSYHAGRNEGDTAGVPTSGGVVTKADAWEKAKLEGIREEYDKMMETIAVWETEKKVKAKRQKDQKENELDKKRAKALGEYNQEMSRINKIAVGARSMADERRRNDEKKIKEKANKIRSTGKVPRSCSCF